MPRKPRIDFPGAWHHVMHRGARRALRLRSGEDAALGGSPGPLGDIPTDIRASYPIEKQMESW